MGEQNDIMLFGDFTLAPYTKNISSENGAVKLSLTQAQKEQVSALVQHIPAMTSTAALSESYIAKFPDGIQHTLIGLKQGGVMSMYQDEAGKFAGTASLYKNNGQALFLGTFTAMAAVSGQYFLTKINDNLEVIKTNIDEILGFLYGDKKAELISEIYFVRYAYENFQSIVCNEAQRGAIIGNLQGSRKVAMKDIEFYVNDLISTADSKDNVDTLMNKAFRIKESLDLSMQLYGISTILEVYYAQNYADSYITYVEKDISSYLGRTEQTIFGVFSKLSGFINGYKGKWHEKVDKSFYEAKIAAIIEPFGKGGGSDMQKFFTETLRAVTRATDFYLTKDGDVYLKAI